MERLNLTWLDWPVFAAIIILGTGSIVVFFGCGIAMDILSHYRNRRIRELNRRLNK